MTEDSDEENVVRQDGVSKRLIRERGERVSE